MFIINFYVAQNGECPVLDYIHSLEGRTDKDSRIKLNKIRDYMATLEEYGTTAGEPYMKHIEGDIWELRPLRDRIFFVGWKDGRFVLLHQFMKKSQKTPKREIDKAKREYDDLKERGDIR